MSWRVSVLVAGLIVGCSEGPVTPPREQPDVDKEPPDEGEQVQRDARAAAPLDASRTPDATPSARDAVVPAEPDAREPTTSNEQDAGPLDSGAPSEPVSCDGKTGLKAGDTNASLMLGGQRRTYIVHVGSKVDGSKPVPLLLDFHPMLFGTASSQRRSSGYAELADQEGFVVAYADGLDNAWNLGPCCTRSREVDDFALALAMIETISNQTCIDEKRIYAAGYSNGGGLSHYLACKHADVFAAVSPAAFDLIEEVPCEPSRPISVISFRGTSDNIVPYAGGASTPPTPYRLDPIHFLGAEGTFKKWAEIDGCKGQPISGANGCQTYSQCEG
ncbi:MAG: PHB depolymerase family esterase, partial [Polyangiales bacterium]